MDLGRAAVLGLFLALAGYQWLRWRWRRAWLDRRWLEATREVDDETDR